MFRVLDLTTSFPRFEGDGSGKFVYKKIAQLNQMGVKNDVLAPMDINTKKEDDFHGIKVKRFNYFFSPKWQKLTYGFGIPTNVKKFFLAKIQIPFLVFVFLLKTLKVGKDYDIIHGNWTLAGIGGLIAARILRKKFVLTVYGVEIFKYKKNFISGFLVKNTNHLIVISQYTLNELKKYYCLQGKTIEILPFGVDEIDEEGRYKAEDFWKNNLGVPKTARVIFSLGNLIERKGHKYLIEAFKSIEQRYSDVYLIIGGRGPQKEFLLRLKKKLVIKRLIFIEYIEENDLPYFFANSYCFVLPSIVDDEGDTEGLGVVNIEALSYGTPVISTNIAGIKDVIENGYNGLLVNQKNPSEIVDAFGKLSNNEKFREMLIKNGYQYIKKKFLWKVIGGKYLLFYKKVYDNSTE